LRDRWPVEEGGKEGRRSGLALKKKNRACDKYKNKENKRHTEINQSLGSSFAL
jgi:hypothetical protein